MIREKQQTWPFHEVSKRTKDLVLAKPIVRYAPTQWQPPQEGMYKANFDVAFFNGIDMAGLGVVLRDYTRNIIACEAWTRCQRCRTRV